MDVEPFCKRMAWLDLISQCEWKGEQRGSTCVTMSFLARRWHWTESKVRRFLKRLQADGMIDAQATNDRTKIDVRKYYEYQRVIDARETDPTDDRSETDGLTDDNINKGLNNKKKTTKGSKDPLDGLKFAIAFNEQAKQALLEWIAYRKEIGKPIKSARTIKSLVNEYANRQHQFIEAVNWTMFKGWQGLADKPANAAMPSNFRKETNLDRAEAELQRLKAQEEQQAMTFEAEAYEIF